MDKSHVLSLRRTDRDGETVLVNVSQTGKKPLDLKLVASEGEHVYPGEVRESNLRSLQASSYGGDLDEWKTTLRYALLEQAATPLPEMLQGFESVASISNNTVTITLRNNIGGIHQRLGAIKLEQNDEEEINIFGWAQTAKAESKELRRTSASSVAEISSLRDEVAKLYQQLDELVKAKKDYETELLNKCAALLNTKKLKIRDQQRLLAGAKIDSSVGEHMRDTRNGNINVKESTPSRKGKRKSNGRTEPESQTAMFDAAAERDAEDDHLDSSRENATPERTDDEATENEDDDAAFSDTARASTESRGYRKSQRTVDDSRRTVENAMDMDESVDVPPPRRDLPFSRKSTSQLGTSERPPPAPAPVTADGDDEDDTEEEL
jgi:hypothetical protein